MTSLAVHLDQRQAGVLAHDPQTNRFAFSYSNGWLSFRERYPLSPHLPLHADGAQTAEAHSTAVRQFFENLLPEGRALDEAAAANNVSKANLVGLMVALGRETAGALSLQLIREGADIESSGGKVDLHAANSRRQLDAEELSYRICARPHEPFSVWDGKIRLSIAGYQDKIAVFKEGGEWYFVEGMQLASTHILKPEPVSRSLAGLTSNEFLCMRLARDVGLPVASVRLVHVPEPVLEVERFDRVAHKDFVRRVHVIDGCQLLGISPAAKYERNYGSGPDVMNIREGASLPKLFELVRSFPNPAAQRMLLLRWTLFQVLIGNTDAHGKNLSFFNDEDGLRITPFYDLVSVLAFADPTIEDSYAMAIGDAFTERALSPYEWAYFGHQCGLQPKLLAREVERMATKLMQVVRTTCRDAAAEGADQAVLAQVCDTILRLAERHMVIAKEITGVDTSLF